MRDLRSNTRRILRTATRTSSTTATVVRSVYIPRLTCLLAHNMDVKAGSHIETWSSALNPLSWNWNGRRTSLSLGTRYLCLTTFWRRIAADMYIRQAILRCLCVSGDVPRPTLANIRHLPDTHTSTTSSTLTCPTSRSPCTPSSSSRRRRMVVTKRGPSFSPYSTRCTLAVCLSVTVDTLCRSPPSTRTGRSPRPRPSRYCARPCR